MQKAVIVGLLACSSLASFQVDPQELKSLWSSWKMYYGKSYTLAEEAARFAIFEENYKKVVQNNAVNDDVKFAMNKFADLTSIEFKSIYTGGLIPTKQQTEKSVIDYSVMDLPTSVDWRSEGAVTKVKDQGQCGSCWTFATTGALEGFYKINSNTLLSFSEQQIVDCDHNNGNAGCEGGDPVEALSYAATAGLELELTYPYTAQDGTCNYKKLIAIKTNGGSSLVTAQSTDAMKTALVAQPVSVAIEADEDVFQLYSSGIIKDGCGSALDHAVLAVGYNTFGSDTSDEAFIVKNSWGSSWGQNGYVYLSTNSTYNSGNGTCGILSQPVVPTN